MVSPYLFFFFGGLTHLTIAVSNPVSNCATTINCLTTITTTTTTTESPTSTSPTGCPTCSPCPTTSCPPTFTGGSGQPVTESQCLPPCSCHCPGGDQPVPQPCGQNDPNCKWLRIQYEDGTVASGRATLDHPNKIYDSAKAINNTQYWYPMDTWLVPAPGSDLEVYIKGQKVADCGGGNFFIPGGTLDTDVEVVGKRSTKYKFYGACTDLTPCVDTQIKDWEQVDHPPFQEQVTKDFDVGKYTSTSDVLLSIADTWGTCEQFSVYADGQELGRTHGPLTLEGDEKFNPIHILGSKLWPGVGANAPYVSITHGGFFGTFRLKQGTQKFTVKALNLVEKEKGWWYSYYGWRLDKPCSA